MPVVITIVIYHIFAIKATFDASVDLGNDVKFWFRTICDSEVNFDASNKEFVYFRTPAPVTTPLS
jgi:hypothetical protein